MEWKIDDDDRVVAVEGICYAGEPKRFNFSQLIEMKLGFGLELRQLKDGAKLPLLTLQSRPGKVIARWDVAPTSEAKKDKLTIAVPNGAHNGQ